MQTQLLIGLFFCHLLADFTHLSTAWMLRAKQLGKPFSPIFVHACVHAVLMFLLLSLVFGISGYKLAVVCCFQLTTHFLIDVWKGRMNSWFPALQSPANKWYWILFGVDQYLHSLVMIGMAYYVAS